MTTLRLLGEVLANESFRRLWVVGSVTSAMRTFGLLGMVFYACNALHFPDDLLDLWPYFVAEMILIVLSGLVIGTVADRVSRQMLLVGSLLAVAVAWAAFGWVCMTDRLEPWHVVVAAIVMPIAWTAEFVARRAMIADVVRPDVVGRAVALDIGTIALTPILGLLILLPMVVYSDVVFFIAPAVFVVAAVVVASISYTPPARDRGRASPLRDVADAFGYVRASRLLVGVLAVSLVMTLAFPFVRTAFPYIPMSHHDFILSRLDPSTLWSPWILVGPGAALGALVIAVGAPQRSYRLIYYLSAIVFAVCLHVLVHPASLDVSLAVLCLTGFAIASFETMQTTLVVTAVPPEMRGRAMGALTLTFAPYALLPVAIGGSGVLPQPMVMTVTATGGLVVLALAGLAWPLVRRGNGVEPT